MTPTICLKCKKPCTEYINTFVLTEEDASPLAQQRLTDWAFKVIKCKEEGRLKMKTDYFDFYQKDDDFKAYVDRYCKKHGIEVAEALTHQIIKDVANLYSELNKADEKVEAETIAPSIVCTCEMEDKSC